VAGKVEWRDDGRTESETHLEIFSFLYKKLYIRPEIPRNWVDTTSRFPFLPRLIELVFRRPALKIPFKNWKFAYVTVDDFVAAGSLQKPQVSTALKRFAVST